MPAGDSFRRGPVAHQKALLLKLGCGGLDQRPSLFSATGLAYDVLRDFIQRGAAFAHPPHPRRDATQAVGNIGTPIVDQELVAELLHDQILYACGIRSS
jgi:hypothetical protein